MAGIQVQTGELVGNQHDAKHQVDGLVKPSDNLARAKRLAQYTERLAAGVYWGVTDQDTLEWLIAQAEELERLKA